MNLAVIAEALVVRYLSSRAIETLKAKEDSQELTYGKIASFYMPLVLTAIIALSIQPLANFSAAYGDHALKSLAVLPVINAFVFIFKAVAISFQEVIISFVGENEKNFEKLLSFAYKILFLIFLGILLFLLLQLVFFGLNGFLDFLMN